MLKTALTAAIIFGTASFALASEFDGNLENRYPHATSQTFQSSNVALTGGQASVNGEKAWFDRASRSFGGGY